MFGLTVRYNDKFYAEVLSSGNFTKLGVWLSLHGMFCWFHLIWFIVSILFHRYFGGSNMLQAGEKRRLCIALYHDSGRFSAVSFMWHWNEVADYDYWRGRSGQQHRRNLPSCADLKHRCSGFLQAIRFRAERENLQLLQTNRTPRLFRHGTAMLWSQEHVNCFVMARRCSGVKNE